MRVMRIDISTGASAIDLFEALKDAMWFFGDESGPLGPFLVVGPWCEFYPTATNEWAGAHKKVCTRSL